ncbi:hypothetical protein [Micromonospora sp. NBC_00421]|uniref:hypothetical protein n=1 Tax=Micromonospora sp. NBC_00421 TaxID=2975976 RepID=UPI002E1C4722
MEKLDHPFAWFVDFVRACFVEYSRFVWAFYGGAPELMAARPAPQPRGVRPAPRSTAARPARWPGPETVEKTP